MWGDEMLEKVITETRLSSHLNGPGAPQLSTQRTNSIHDSPGKKAKGTELCAMPR